MHQLFLDDFKTGDIYKSVSHTLNDSHFTLFAAITSDAHPIHYDVEYAKAHGWRGPVAHGLLLLSMCALGAAPISHALNESMVAMLGSEARYKLPAFVGDTLYPEFKVSGIEPKGAARGILKLEIALYNQKRELLLQGSHTLMLKRRNVDTASSSAGSPL